MKRKELTGFIAIATVLLIFALGCLNYSFFIGHTASFNMLYELQGIYNSNPSGKSLTLSNEKVVELIEVATQDKKRWHRTLTLSSKMMFISAVILFLLGSVQIALSIYIYRRDIAVPPQSAGSN